MAVSVYEGPLADGRKYGVIGRVRVFYVGDPGVAGHVVGRGVQGDRVAGICRDVHAVDQEAVRGLDDDLRVAGCIFHGFGRGNGSEGAGVVGLVPLVLGGVIYEDLVVVRASVDFIIIRVDVVVRGIGLFRLGVDVVVGAEPCGPDLVRGIFRAHVVDAGGQDFLVAQGQGTDEVLGLVALPVILVVDLAENVRGHGGFFIDGLVLVQAPGVGHMVVGIDRYLSVGKAVAGTLLDGCGPVRISGAGIVHDVPVQGEIAVGPVEVFRRDQAVEVYGVNVGNVDDFGLVAAVKHVVHVQGLREVLLVHREILDGRAVVEHVVEAAAAL